MRESRALIGDGDDTLGDAQAARSRRGGCSTVGDLSNRRATRRGDRAEVGKGRTRERNRGAGGGAGRPSGGEGPVEGTSRLADGAVRRARIQVRERGGNFRTR